MKESTPHKRPKSILAACLMLIVSLSLTGLAAYYAKHRVEMEAREHFDYEVKESTFAIRQRMLAYEYILRGGAALFAGSVKVERAEWQAYVKSLGVDKNYPGILGMGFVKYIPSSRKDAHIREIRAEGFPDYTIWPEGTRHDYTSILYLEPDSPRSRQRLGYDMFTEPSLQAVMDRAKDTGMPAISRKVNLVRETDDKAQVDFIMYIPVYRNGEPTDSIEERRAALEGYVFSSFRMKDLMNGLLGVEKLLIDIEIFDGNISPETLMYDSDSQDRFHSKDYNPAFATTITLEVSGHGWPIFFSALPSFGQGAKNDHYYVLLAGTIISLLLFTVALSLANTNTKAVELANRMTEALQKSEHRLHSLLHALPVGVFYLDADGKCTYVNNRWCEMSGMTSEEALGSGWMQVLHPDDRELVAAKRLDAINKGLPYENEFRYLCRDGRIVWVVGKALPLKDANGNVSGYLGTVIDVTERKKAEAENLQLQAKMLHGQKLESLGVLAGGIAHDFNNLLMSIMGNTEVALIDLPADSPGRKSVEKTKEVVQRAADLTKQMLAYSGRGKFIIENVNLSRLVEDMTELLKVSIKKNVTIKYELAPDLPQVEADATQIRQVAMNLIINASDAIGDNQGILTVTTGVMECDHEYLRDAEIGKELPETTCVYLDVNDNGCGMDEETKAKIFDPFFTTKFTGRGLGLAAVLGIVRGHKGALKLYSKPGEGTTFRVLLPISDKHTETCPEVDKNTEKWNGRGTILLVDDEEEILTVTRMILEGKGFTVLTAINGCTGIELFREHKDEITAVVLDLTMPCMNGEEAFLEMKKIRSDVKAILSSGYNEEEVSLLFNGEGFAGFLQKPYALSDLMTKLRDVLG